MANTLNPLSNSYRYSTMAMPWGDSLASYFEPKNDHDVLKTSIECIIFTMLGERPMLCDFGSNIWELIFDQSDVTLEGELSSIVQQVVPRWDPRLEVLNVTTDVVNRQDNQVAVTVTYRDRYNPKMEPQTHTIIVGK